MRKPEPGVCLFLVLVLAAITLWAWLMGGLAYLVVQSISPPHASLAAHVVGWAVGVTFFLVLVVRALLIRRYIAVLFEKDPKS